MSGDEQGAALTPTQREFLRGDKDDLSDAAERMTRKRIADRLQFTITEDMPLLADAIQRGEIDPDKVTDSAGFQEFISGLQSQISVAYAIARSAGFEADRLVEDALEEAREGRAEVLFEQYQEEPKSLTFEEFDILLEQGYLEAEDRPSLVEDLRRSEPEMASPEEVAERLEEDEDDDS